MANMTTGLKVEEAQQIMLPEKFEALVASAGGIDELKTDFLLTPLDPAYLEMCMAGDPLRLRIRKLLSNTKNSDEPIFKDEVPSETQRVLMLVQANESGTIDLIRALDPDPSLTWGPIDDKALPDQLLLHRAFEGAVDLLKMSDGTEYKNLNIGIDDPRHLVIETGAGFQIIAIADVLCISRSGATWTLVNGEKDSA